MSTAAVVGDAIVISVLTIVGFATHETLGQTGRLLVTIGAFLAAWAFVAPWFGAFDRTNIAEAARVWRIALAWVAAAPLGAVLRGLMLRQDVPPVFVLVMTVVTGAGLVVWRVVLSRFA
jgi:hypothetical protein